MEDILQHYTSVPIVTRCYLTAVFLIALGQTYGLLSPMSLYFSWDLVFRHGEWWRLATTFCYYGPLGVNFFFHVRSIYVFFAKMEEHFYYNKTHDFLYTILKVCGLVMLLTPAMMFPFLSSCFTFAMLYLYSRRYPDEHLVIYGIIPAPAPYMPYIILGLSFILNGSEASGLVQDLIGILAGHIVWYASDVLPLIIGFDPTLPPAKVRRLFGGGGAAPQRREDGW